MRKDGQYSHLSTRPSAERLPGYSEQEALDTLGYYHANGNNDDPLVQFEFQEIKASIEEEKIQNQTNWFDLFRTPGNRRRMRVILAIAVFSQWSGNGLMSVPRRFTDTELLIYESGSQLILSVLALFLFVFDRRNGDLT